jgi:ATP-dependent RNA helicase HelY
MTCHLGDFTEYAALRRSLTDREAELARSGAAARKAAAVESLERLRPGDVIRVPAGRRAGYAVVLDTGVVGGDGPRPTVLTAERQVRRLTVVDFPRPVEALSRLRIPRTFNPRNPQSRRDLASTLRTHLGEVDVDDGGGRGRAAHGSRAASTDDAEVARLRRTLRQHPCHGCNEREEHARWAERWFRLRRDTDSLERRVDGRTNTLARTFDRVCQLLESLGYLAGESVTERGSRLGRLYTELDLLAAECLRAGVWEELSPPELAACVSALVYESRQPDDAAPARLPGGGVRPALVETVRLWGHLELVEREHRLDLSREPDLGFAWTAYRWASGHSLDAVLSEAELPAGDFVRWTKQLVDLLGQVADAAPEASRVRATAPAAVEALRRGVVAYSSVS